MSLRVIIVGMGVQGEKRKRVAGEDVVATVDPINPNADYRELGQVPLDGFDAALACVPDSAKPNLLLYLLRNGKHALVEKPLLAQRPGELARLKETAARGGAVSYTAYNHRFEPHFVRMKELLDSGELGRVYAVRMFYGNGTAGLVRESPWRDEGAGVLPDLGSHLLDTLLFWFGADAFRAPFRIRCANRFENRSFDHVVIDCDGRIVVQLEMTLLMWRNHFACDVMAENGTAHIESLCKWGPSVFRHRTRVRPSGQPPERIETLIQPDPTWAREYEHFKALCAAGGPGNIDNDIWIDEQLKALSQEALRGAA